MKERIYYKSFRDCKKENAGNFRIIFSTQKEFEIFFPHSAMETAVGNKHQP